MALFPNRTWNAIRSAAKDIGVHRFRSSGIPVLLSQEDARLAAWAIACEGSIQLLSNRGTLMPRLSLFNTARELVVKFREIVGCGVVWTQVAKPKFNQRECYAWYLYGIMPCLSFSEAIRPFLPIKQEQCALLIEYCRHRQTFGWHGGKNEKDSAIRCRMLELNARGRGRTKQKWRDKNGIRYELGER